MKNVNFKKLMSTACLLGFVGTTSAMAGPDNDSFDIPEGKIRASHSIGKVEKLTFEDGQFTATINGKDHKIQKYDVDKSIRNASAEQLEGFLQLGGSLIVGQLITIGHDEKDYSITIGGGLLGGKPPIIIGGRPLGRQIRDAIKSKLKPKPVAPKKLKEAQRHRKNDASGASRHGLPS